MRAFVRGLAFGLGLACSLFALDMFARGFLMLGLAGHCVASFVAGCVAAAADGCSEQERHRRFGCALALSVCVPGVGALGVLLVLVPAWARGREDDAAAGGERFVETLELACGFEALTPETSRSGSRVALLLTQRTDSSRASVRALRRALRHPEEEVRLLAHALLERHESRIREAIAAAQHELSAAREREERFQLLRRLAHLHWALVARELVPRELTRETLTRASEFACDAVALRTSAELSLLRVRIASRLQDPRGLPASDC